MTKLTAVLGACLLLMACAPTAPQRSTAELDTLLRTAVDQRRVPNAVAMVGTHDAVIYRSAVKVPEDTIFAIASMTKPVTSVAVMQLVEAGKVKLDEPASTYAPELAKVQVLEGGKLRPPKSQPTIRQLLSHTAGFVYEFMNRDFRDYVAKGKASSMMTGDDKFLQAPLFFDPGTRWEYGINTDWLGRIVEKVSGLSLEAYFRQNIFDPLAMPDTFFNVPQEKQSRMAHIFQRNQDGSLAEQPASPFKPTTFFSGGGGLFSTAADYLQFTRALLSGGALGGKRILKPETIAMMGQNQIGEMSLRPFSSLVPQLAKDGATLPGGLDRFGLGFALNTKAQEKGRGANTLAWAGIFNTFFWIDRERKLSAVLMTQMSPGLDDGPAALLSDFEKAVYAWRE
jgi:methyl acetate hydrolase